MAAILRGAAKLAPKLGGIARKAGGLIGRVGGMIGRNRGTIATTGAVIGAGAISDRLSRGGFGGGGSELFGLPLITDAFAVETLRAPRGYVLIQNPESDDPQDKIAVLKEVAYALKLRKRPSGGGGISSRDIRTARHVQRVIGKLTVNRKPKFRLKTGKRGR
jgi:hypothetical protein